MIRALLLKLKRLLSRLAVLGVIPLWILRALVFIYRWLRFAYHAHVHPRRILGRLIPAALVCGVSYYVAGQIISEQPMRAIALSVSLLIIGVLVSRLYVALALFVVLAATFIWPSAIPKPITFGGAGLHFGEVLLIFILFTAYLKAYSEKRQMPSPLTPAVVFLFFTVLLSLAVSYRQYLANPRGFYDFKTVYNAARPLFPYAFFFGILFGIRNKRELRLFFNIALGLGCFVAFLVVVQYVVGRSTQLFFGMPENLIMGAIKGEQEDVSRIQPPGVPLNVLMFLTAFFLAVSHSGKQAKVYWLLTAVLTGGLALSFARNAWITAAFSFCLMLIIVPKQAKGRLAMGMIFGTVAGGLFLGTLMVLAPSRGAGLQKALSNRVQSIFAVRETYNDPSIKNRRTENREALTIALQNPIFGTGVGSPIRHEYLTRVRGGAVPFSTDMIHNSYLDIWVHYGAFGLFAFAWLSAVFLYRALRLYRRADELWVRCFALTFAINYVGWLMRSFVVMMMVRQQAEITVTAFAWGMVEVASLLYIPKSQSEQRRELSQARMVPVGVHDLPVSRS
ncbi:MAG: O-antigen ligase family protein [Armatimonadota bacterium]|nr:O-antigen ligase family protein [Armatimonadota bacterium]